MRYVVLDFETYPVNGKSYIMEIGCVEVIDGVIGQTFHSMVRPVADVSPFVLKLTGISQDELDIAPTFLDIMGEFYNFIQNSVVVAHNAQLDALSYESLCSYLDIKPQSFLWLDSQDLIKILDPTVQTLQLQSLLTMHNLCSMVSHRAKEDALGLAKLLMHYFKQHSIKLTKQEVRFLKKSQLSSIRLLIQFLLSTAHVELNDGGGVTEVPSYNQLNSDRCRDSNDVIGHYNVSLDDLKARMHSDRRQQLLVSDARVYSEIPYLSLPSHYVFPDKISRLYPILTDARASHIEIVELHGIINWLRHTQSFQITDLNDQLIQRYHHLVKDVLDTHPLAIANFVRQRLMAYFSEGYLVECHYDMLILLVQHAPLVLSDVCIVIHNFIHFNHHLSQSNETVFSFSSLKRVSKLILNLAFIIDYLTYVGEDNLKFVQDFARLKSVIHLMNEEKLQLFRKVDELVDTLSVNIYAFEKRQVLINENVFETMEWQDIMGSLTVIIHFFDEVLKLLKKISFYIYPELNAWFSDLIYVIRSIQTRAQLFLNLPSQQVLYIDTFIKHKPSNCRLVIKNIFEHDFYKLLMASSAGVNVHQQFYVTFMRDYMMQMLGVRQVNQWGENGAVSFNDVDINIGFNSKDYVHSLITTESRYGPLVIVLFSKKQLRYWKQKLRGLVLSQQLDSSIQIHFFTYDDFIKLSKSRQWKTATHKIFFPEFFMPDVFQPIHHVRLSSHIGSEDAYIQFAFYEQFHLVLMALEHVCIAPMVFNIDSRYKSVIPEFN